MNVFKSVMFIFWLYVFDAVWVVNILAKQISNLLSLSKGFLDQIKTPVIFEWVTVRN